MEKMMNVLRKKDGYISIETIIVAGLVIGLGAVSIKKFQNNANGVTEKAITTVGDVQNNYEFTTRNS